MDLNMETVIFHIGLTWNFHVNANSGTQFCACLRIVFYNSLFDFETQLNLTEDVPLSSRSMAAYECLYDYDLQEACIAMYVIQ